MSKRRIVPGIEEDNKTTVGSQPRTLIARIAFQVYRKRLLVGCVLFAFLITLGVFAKNEWLPRTDHFGNKTTWFGRPLPKNASGIWNPFAAPLPSPTPQLSKELIYAGSKLLAVEDANANPAPPTDLAVWRPSTGTWWVMGGQGSAPVSQSWGINGDKPVPGDYDGDGKTDFSVFRPITGQAGEWYVLRSSDGSWEPIISWGSAADILVPADYDGDGKTDRAVWRPSDGVWYIVKSSTGTSIYETYGTTGDVPMPADYDGDGRADVAVWRNSNKTFYSKNTSNGAAQSVATPPGTVPDSDEWRAAGSDYDGDGRAEYALYDKNSAMWYILQSSSGSLVVEQWGNAEDLPVHNDYDGDGKCDIAVWRPVDSPAGTLGKWYIRQSALSNAQRVEQWGIQGDIPVPAFYRR